MMSNQETHYQKMLQIQSKMEATDVFRKVLGKLKARTLEQKLKDPNSLESKTLAAMIAMVAIIQWTEMAIARAAAELHYIKQTLERGNIKDQGDQARAIPRDQDKEKQPVEKPVGIIELQDRLTAVKSQLDELKQYRTQLDQQYEEAIDQFRAMHGEEIREALEGLGIANEEQIEQFHELNKQKALPLSIDRIMASHEQAIQEAQAAGAPPPPPLPPREQVDARYQQIRETGWEAALLALMVGVYKNNPDRPEGAIRAALELLPLMREVANGQVGALENLHLYFEGKRNELADKIIEVENQREVLESEIYKLTASWTPVMKPSFMSGQRQSRDDANEREEESPTRSLK